MKMPFDLAEELQSRLAEYLPIDNPHPQDIFYGCTDGSRDVRTQWQIAVDMIYRLAMTGLIRLWSGEMLKEYGSPEFFEEARGFCEALAQLNPEGREAYASYPGYGIPWVGFNLCMTDTTRHLLAKHSLIWSKEKDLPFNEAFIEDIEALFELHGVAWSDTPLIPIRAEPTNG